MFYTGQESELGTDQNIDFSNLENVSAYIPQIRDPSLAFPLIACNMDDVPLHFLDFQLPEGSIDDLNVIFDVPYEGMRRRRKMKTADGSLRVLSDHDEYHVDNPDDEEKPIFDIVKHWPYGGRRL